MRDKIARSPSITAVSSKLSATIVRSLLALGLTPAVAHAATLLTVDLSTTVRPVGHVASGSLYGALVPRDMPPRGGSNVRELS